MKIPGGERPVIEEAKVRDYLLSPEHPVGRAKAQFFVPLGFERTNWSVLRDQLQQLASVDAELGASTRFGQKYVVPSTIQGPSGRRASLVVGWIILNGEDFRGS